ncbi:MAG TPA: tetratricopeptide repeat protein, partial [bacterium]
MRKITFDTVVMIILCMSCFFPGKNLSSQSIKADNEFAFAQKLYEDKLYTLAGQQLRAFANANPDHDKADDALLLSGNAFFDGGKLDAAFESYKELEIGFPQSPLLPQSRYRLAQCFLHQNKFAEAAESFKRVAVFHPQSDWAARGYLEAGRCYLKAGLLMPARNSFLTLIQTYPDKPERLEAHLDLVESYFQHEDYQEALSQIDGIFRSFGADFKDPRVYLL